MTEPVAALAAPATRRRPWLTVALCALVIGVALVGWATPGAELPAWTWRPADEIWRGKPWILVTSAFVHAQVWHLAFNLYWMWVLGRDVEGLLGPARLLAFTVIAAFVSGAAQLAIAGEAGIGFSGVGYAMFGLAWVVSIHRPDLGLRISRQTARAFGVWLLFGIFATALKLVNFGNAAHVAGGAFGLCVGFWYTGRWRVLARTGIGSLISAAAVVALWAPWSPQWQFARALDAYDRADYSRTLRFLDASARRGENPARIAGTKAWVHHAAGDDPAAREDLRQLRKLDPAAAQRMAAYLFPN